MKCDHCSRAVKGVKYKCLDCDGIIFCSHCQRAGIHNHHTLVEATNDGRSRNLPLASAAAATRTTAAFLGPVAAIQETSQPYGVGVSGHRRPPVGPRGRQGSLDEAETPFNDSRRLSTASLPFGRTQNPHRMSTTSVTSLPFGNRDDPLRQSTISLPCGYTGDTRGQSMASLHYGIREDPQRQSTASLPYGIVPEAPCIQRIDSYPSFGCLPPEVVSDGSGRPTQQPPGVKSTNRMSSTSRNSVESSTPADDFQTLADGCKSPDRGQRGGGGVDWEDSVEGTERYRSHDLRQSHPYGVAPVVPPRTPLPNRGDDPYTSRWSPAAPTDSFRRVELSILNPEYKAVLQNVHQMGGTKFTDKVQMISRVENYRLYKTFRCCREEQTRVNDRGNVNERILWHGTSVDVLTNIYRDGFNRSYCGKNATAYGDGVYFATSFEYSASPTYSPPDSKGRKYIFQCRVLTGHYTQGQPGLKEPPLRSNEFRFDSVVDNMSAPAMFVVFKDMQVYPEYVITLTQ